MRFVWDPDKNRKLIIERHISFEQIVYHLGRGNLWKTMDHPNQEKYQGQRIFLVVIDSYIYMVPHRIDEDRVILKTIIPSRKYTKEFLRSQELSHEVQ